MSSTPALLSIDQGTTSSRAIVFDTDGNQVSVAQQEFPQIYPHEGWVEHDPEAIWQTTLDTCQQAIAEAKVKGFTVVSIGITNQRETTVVWARDSGKPVYNAIVWQDRRTAAFCAQLKKQGAEDQVQQRTGLLVDPYFSASKISWVLDQVEGARAAAERGELLFGTIDCFLIYRLTGGNSHVTDATNASRTSLYNIHTGQWDEDLLRLFDVPREVLPRVLDCVDDFGTTAPQLFGEPIPITGVAGDQQAATVGQCCFDKGSIKSTYGTGCFVLMNTGDLPVVSKSRLLTTIAYQIKGKPTYAIEGSIFIAGAAMQWLRDGIGLINNAAQSEAMARGLKGNSGVYMVPAFTGLGAPWWDPDVRGAIFGLTRGTGPEHIVRATLESVAYQTADLFAAMAEDGITPTTLRVDGGMVANSWLLQFLADILNMTVQRPAMLETTALGAAYLSGIGSGVFESLEALQSRWRAKATFNPQLAEDSRNTLLAGWHDAVFRLVKPVTG
jgi:glycerol kinase